MKNHGIYDVYLTGSRTYVNRVVWEAENGRYYINYYGMKIEVVHSRTGYRTVERY